MLAQEHPKQYSTSVRSALVVAALAALIFSFHAAEAEAAELAACQAVHTIAPADSLTGLSHFYFGGGGYEYAILQATNARTGDLNFEFIRNPGKLPVSGRLCIPDRPEGDRRRLRYEAYQRAVRETVLPRASDISHSLLKVEPSEPVRVASWIRSDELSNFRPNGNWVSVAPNDMWVTLVPEIKSFCQAFAKDHGADWDQLTLRLEQRLGLPPGAAKTTFLEIAIKDPGNPAHLFRPCMSPSTNTTACELEPPPRSNEQHANWIFRQYYSSFAQATPYQYPWTSLGYTFDWAVLEGPPGRGDFVRFGASEFVIPKGAAIEVLATIDTARYCAPQSRKGSG